MKRITALMLLPFICTAMTARAEELDEDLVRKEKAERVKQLLFKVGLTDPMFQETAIYIDEQIKDDYFYFSEDKYENLNYGIRHELGSPKLKRIQFYLRPDDSNYEYTVSGEEIMLRYHMDITW
jgi:hypothetical protein